MNWINKPQMNPILPNHDFISPAQLDHSVQAVFEVSSAVHYVKQGESTNQENGESCGDGEREKNKIHMRIIIINDIWQATIYILFDTLS